MTQWLTEHIASQGAYAVFLLMLVDAVFPAFSELVMLYGGAVAAGAFASAQHVSLFGAEIGFGVGAYITIALAGTIGYLIGSIIGWWIGAAGGRPLLERRGKWFHLTAERIGRAERWFDRWGNIGVLIGRVTPVVRSFVSIPAGVFRVPFLPYTTLTAIGSAIWAFLFAGIGYGVGASYERFDRGFRYVEYVVVAGVLALVAYLVYAARVRRRAADSPR